MWKKIRSLLDKYIFSVESPLDARLINVTCLAGITAVICTMIIRYITGASLIVIAIFAVFLLAAILIMFLSNRTGHYRFYKILLIILLCFTIVPSSFFIFGGADSAIEGYFILALMVIVLLTKGWLAAVLIFLHVCIVLLCYFIQFKHPELIIHLSRGVDYTGNLRYLNRTLAYLISGFCIVLVVGIHGRFYRSEKDRGETAARDLESAQHTISVMFNSNPHSNILLNNKFQIIDCNPAALELTGFSSKDELKSGFFKYINRGTPEFQPDGKPSVSLLEHLKTAAHTGAVHFDTELVFPPPKEKKILDVELKRIPYGRSFAIVGCFIDTTMLWETKEALLAKDRLLSVMNMVATTLCAEGLCDTGILNSMRILANGADLDRIYVWRSSKTNDKYIYTPILNWATDKVIPGKTGKTVRIGEVVSLTETLPGWEEKLLRGECINSPLVKLTENEKNMLGQYGIKSVLYVPVFVEDQFWGFVSYDDCHSSRTFTSSDVDILQSGGNLIAGAVLRNEMNKKISETAVRLNTVISHYSGVIWSVDRSGLITTFNGKYLKKIGLSPGFLEGKKLELALMKNRHLDVDKNFNETILDGKERDWVGNIDGLTYHHHITPLLDDVGNIIGVIGSTEDITETHRLQNELKSAMEEAQAASRAKSDFLSNMSHEIRTPMNAIIGMTNIGKSSGDIDRMVYAFGKIDEASTHLLGIINDILDMSKIEAGKFELSFEEFNFEKMLRKVSDVNSFRIDEKNQKFVVRVDRNIPLMLIGDDQRLAQVITNLLSNAVKFTPEGGRINLDAVLEGEENSIVTIRVELRDSGIGISPEQQSRLFTSFQQAESGTTRKFGGTGLGLAISKRIVEMMNGRIWIDSELNKGATFAFTIKAQRAAGQPPVTAIQGASISTLRVLAVDDISDVRDFFLDAARQLNFHCDTAGSGDEAINLIEQNGSYDVYFVDWKMAGMNGLELSRRIKKITPKNSLLVLVSSGDFNSVYEEAKEAGIQNFISKPLFLSSIADCINEYLGLDNIRSEKNGDEITSEDQYDTNHILLVEDIEINREIVMALLEPTKISIDTAENGRIALSMYRQSPEKYDMIFMDVQMPDMDGYESTNLIREFEQEKGEILQQQFRRVPIIAMTANVFREDYEKCIAAGMDDHLGKPVSLQEILEKLRKYLKNNGE